MTTFEAHAMRHLSITYSQLAEAGACKPGLDQFKSLFGESVEVTEELAVQHAQTLNFDWAGDRLLSGAQWEAYDATRGAAWEAYVAACRVAWEAYDAARDAAWEAFNATRGAAHATYRTALALAFVRAYNSEVTP